MNGNVSKELRMIGHMEHSKQSTSRHNKLGLKDPMDPKNTGEEVNDYLARAIDARSIDRLRSQHCRRVLLTFRDATVEEKFAKERDDLLPAYFAFSLIAFLCIFATQTIIIPRSLLSLGVFICGLAVAILVVILVVSERSEYCPRWLLSLSQSVSNSRTISQILASFIVMVLFLCSIASMFLLDLTSYRDCLPSVFEFSSSPYNSSSVIMGRGQNDLSVNRALLNNSWSNVVADDAEPNKFTATMNFTLGEEENFCHDKPTSHFPDYFTFCVLIVMVSCAVYQMMFSFIKLILLVGVCVAYLTMVLATHGILFDNYDYLLMLHVGSSKEHTYASQHVTVAVLIGFTAALFIHGRQTEATLRLDFLWKRQAHDEKDDIEHLQAYNRKLIANILPEHVAEHFLSVDKAPDELYHEQCECVCILFASIPNFSEFYIELEANNEGVECLRLLNEIIADFDEILAEDQFKCVEKIKSTGATYMAASGLTKTSCDMRHYSHVTAMADFALRLREQLEYVNEHSFNNFKIRIGINIGPVVAGVIGARKPQYDIWGNAVNVASRMDSTGELGKIQVTQEMYQILSAKGYPLTCRGTIEVKGKGNMVTYILHGDKQGTPKEELCNSEEKS